MTFASLMGALREKWLTLLAGALVGLLVGGLASLATPHSYAATASVYVAGIDNGPGADVVAGSLLSPQRVASYRELLTSGRVLDLVSQRLGTPVSSSTVTATSRSDSAVFSVAATTGDPARSAVVANAVAERFVEVISELERPGGPGQPPSMSASVVSRAQPPAVPASPRTPSNLLVGLVVGLVSASAAVIVRAATDTSLRSPSALRSTVGGVALGSLPRCPKSRDGHGRQDEQFDEAVRRLRTRLRLATEADPAPVLAFTSAMPGEGTTTVVCALGRAFAHRSRVLVVDANLRRPAVADHLGLGDGVGLADVLAGQVSAEEAIRRVGEVDVLSAGWSPDDPAELLSSPMTAELLRELRARYDVVLVDSPALVPVVDAVVIARRVDGVVLLSREGQARARLETALDALGEVGAPLVGSVLTMASCAFPESYEKARSVGAPARTPPPMVVTSPSTPGDVRGDSRSDAVAGGRVDGRGGRGA